MSIKLFQNPVIPTEFGIQQPFDIFSLRKFTHDLELPQICIFCLHHIQSSLALLRIHLIPLEKAVLYAIKYKNLEDTFPRVKPKRKPGKKKKQRLIKTCLTEEI